MKTIITLLLLTALTAQAEVCFVKPYSPPYTFITRYIFKNCSAIPEKDKSVKGMKNLHATMYKYGYRKARSFYQSDEWMLIEKNGTPGAGDKNYCLALVNLRGSSGEGSGPIKFNCTDVPYLSLSIPRDMYLLMDHMDSEGYELLFNIDDSYYIFQEK